MQHIAYIGIGSNVGDRLGHGRDAIASLASTSGVTIQRVSPWFESLPVPMQGESTRAIPAYLNGACQITTSLPPHELLNALQSIEGGLGRPRLRAKGSPRTLDLDLLLYDDLILNEPDLVIPHPEMAKRLFVLAPLYAIAPQVRDPVSGKTVAELYHDKTSVPPGQQHETLWVFR